MRLIKYALQLLCCYLCRLQLDIARFVYACICIAIDSFVSAHRAMDLRYLVGNGLAFIYLANTSLIRMYWQFVHLNRKHCCFASSLSLSRPYHLAHSLHLVWLVCTLVWTNVSSWHCYSVHCNRPDKSIPPKKHRCVYKRFHGISYSPKSIWYRFLSLLLLFQIKSRLNYRRAPLQIYIDFLWIDSRAHDRRNETEEMEQSILIQIFN